MKPLVALSGVTRAYDTPTGRFMALRGVDLQVGTGEFVAVIGRSGSGKSTLINAIAGIDRPTAGEVLVAGTRIDQLSEDRVARWRGVHLGVIFQFFQLLPTLTLLENVVLPMEFARIGSGRERAARALGLLERVDMAAHAHKLPSGVSGGQQQRIAVARALANDPALIVADEPTGSLDARTADRIFQLFEELVDQGKTILMVTHDNDLATRASRVVLISDGEVTESHVRTALAGLDSAKLAEISARLEPMVLDAGSPVFARGDDSERFYIVIRGEVELRAADGQVITLGPGAHFGETGVLRGQPREEDATVSEVADASLVALDADAFLRLSVQDHLGGDAIARVMRERLTTDTLRAAMPGSLVSDIDSLADQATLRTYGAGEVIVRRNDPLEAFVVVLEGEVDVIGSDGVGVSYRYRAGRHFGTRGLAAGGRSIAELRASTDHATTSVASIPEALYRRLRDGEGRPTPEHLAQMLADAVTHGRPG